jgi:hypothetical protein
MTIAIVRMIRIWNDDCCNDWSCNFN